MRRLGAAWCWLFGHTPLPHDSDSTGEWLRWWQCDRCGEVWT